MIQDRIAKLIQIFSNLPEAIVAYIQAKGPALKTRIVFVRGLIIQIYLQFKTKPQKYKSIVLGGIALLFILLRLILYAMPHLKPATIVASSPQDKEVEIEQSAPISIEFDRPVMRDSVEKAFMVEPPTSGSFSWDSDQSMTFTPDKPWQRGKTYTYGFSRAIVSKFYIPAKISVNFSFSTQGLPRIVLKAPEIEAPETKTPITVIFSQAMRPLTTATASAVFEQILNISPQIKGEGRWLGTTAYQFMPDINYSKATTYTVSVAPGLTSSDGYSLDQDYVWQFSSIRPHVIRTGLGSSSYYSSGSILPTASVSAYLNIPPDPKLQLSDYFVVTDSTGTQVKGSIIARRSEMHFVPNSWWKRAENYTAVVKKGLINAEGPNGLEEDYQWKFSSLPHLAVSASYPNNGELAADREEGITISFNTKLAKQDFGSFVTVNPPLTGEDAGKTVSCDESCKAINIPGKLTRNTSYEVKLKKGVNDIYGESLASDYTLVFKTGPHKTSLGFVPGNLQVVMFNQRIPTQVFIRSKNVNKVTYSLYKMEAADFFEAENSSLQGSLWEIYMPKQQIYKTWSESVNIVEDEYVKQSVIITDVNGSQLEPGYYFLSAKADSGDTLKLAFLNSRSSLTVKDSDDQLLVWATDQTSSQTIGGMDIQVQDKQGTVLAYGKTGEDGVSLLKIEPKTDQRDYNEYRYVFGAKDGDMTMTSTRWSRGLSRYDFDLPYYEQFEDVEYPIYMVLDRPLYRPGQEVLYKGILRKDTDGVFSSVATGDKVAVEVKDAMGREIYSETKELNSYGTFSGKLALSSDANLGYYSISAKYQSQTRDYSTMFQVEEYKRQDFKVMVTPLKDDFVSGDKLTADITASYYFGAPIKQASVFYTIKSEDYFYFWEEHPQYEFGQPESYWYRPWSEHGGGRDNLLTEARTVTDSNGKVNIAVPIDMFSEKQSKRLIVDAAVTDISNQVVGVSQDIIFHKSGVYVGVKPRDYVNSSGKESTIDFVTLDPRKNSAANRPVSLEIQHLSWVSTREEDPGDGSFYYRNKQIETTVETLSGTTDERGFGSVTFVPSKGGTHKVIAKTFDDRGNAMTSSTYMWISGEGYESSRENHDRIPLSTDKYSYKNGDNATLFINTPFATDSAKTLLTFERAAVFDYKVIDVDSQHTTYTFPITGKMLPNAYISALLVRGGSSFSKPPEFKIGYTELRVEDDAKQLSVDIQTDKDRYYPRDTVKTKLRVTDGVGKPVKSEMSLALVDRSLLDMTTIEMIDPYGFFYKPRDLGVATSQSLTFSLNRINENVNSDSKGGDGSQESKLSTKRKYFPETDYWNAHIETDDNGNASVDIPLADNLTTWKFTAVANSDSDAFGKGSKEILATKDVLLRPMLPRFLALGDEAIMGVVLLNKAEQDLTTAVTLQAQHANVSGENTQQVFVAKGDQASVTWKVSASKQKEIAVNFTAKDTSGTVLDDIEIVLPVVLYHTPETTAAAGDLTSQKTEQLNLPTDIVPNRGELDISLSSSLLGSLIDSYSYLIEYPYGCTEQTTSRFYPLISLYTLMKKNKITQLGAYKQEDLATIISTGIQKLQNEQKSDGGWGWWMDSRFSDPYLSAYAYQALLESQKEGFTVAEQTLSGALDYLLAKLGTNNQSSLDVQSFMVYVISQADPGIVTSFTETLYKERPKLSLEAKAYLLHAMTLNKRSESHRKALRDEIMASMRKTATGVHWENKKRDAYYSLLGSDISTTATILEVLSTIEPSNPLLSDIARHFQAALRDNYWNSTRTTASVLHALLSYSKLKGDFGASYSYTAKLNGNTIESGKISKDTFGGFTSVSKAIQELGLGQNNTLVFNKVGSGTLYYNMNLHYFLPYTDIMPLDRGFTIMREYVDDEGKPIPNNTVKVNQFLGIKLTLVLNYTRRNILIEDKLPAGLDAVNKNLKNAVSDPITKTKLSLGTHPLYYDHVEFRDDRTAFFAGQLGPGVYEVIYPVHAAIPGKYHRAPALVYDQYMPDIMGHTDGGWFTVLE